MIYQSPTTPYHHHSSILMTCSTAHRARVWSYGAILNNRVNFLLMKSTPHPAPTSERTGNWRRFLYQNIKSGWVENATATEARMNLEFASVSDGELVEGRGRADSMEGSGSVHSLTRTASDYCSLLNILNDKKELYVLYLKHSNYLLTTYCVGIYCLAFLFE